MNTQLNTLLPARSQNLALRRASRKGVPAYPLRSNPGTPFLDQDKTHFVEERQAQSWAGASGQQGSGRTRTTTRQTEGRGGKTEQVTG